MDHYGKRCIALAPRVILAGEDKWINAGTGIPSDLYFEGQAVSCGRRREAGKLNPGRNRGHGRDRHTAREATGSVDVQSDWHLSGRPGNGGLIEAEREIRGQHDGEVRAHLD